MLCFIPPPFENTIAEENGIFACWKYRWHHGLAVFHRRPDAEEGFFIAKWVQGQWPWRGVQGPRRPLAWFL